jgi:hypothetical protein
VKYRSQSRFQQLNSKRVRLVNVCGAFGVGSFAVGTFRTELCDGAPSIIVRRAVWSPATYLACACRSWATRCSFAVFSLQASNSSSSMSTASRSGALWATEGDSVRFWGVRSRSSRSRSPLNGSESILSGWALDGSPCSSCVPVVSLGVKGSTEGRLGTLMLVYAL